MNSLNLQASHSKIINPSIYSNTSLISDIEKISDKNTLVTNEQIINIIIKYFFAYGHIESIDAIVPLEDIETIFSISHLYFEMLEKHPNTKMDIQDPAIIDVLNFIQINGYPIVMLGDVAATTSIVKSIIDITIDPKEYEQKYTGLDLGTGTGILLLAHYIQALRSGFTDIKNIGIELIPYSAQQSDILIKKIGVGEVIQGDTTNIDTYKKLFGDRILTHISNETIPHSSVSMTGKNDPFHQNNEAIYDCLKNNISSSTHFFPKQIEMEFELGGWNQTIHGNNDNQFVSPFLKNLEMETLKMESITFPENWRIFNQLHAKSIQIDDKMIPLNQIGHHLKEEGLVEHLEWWRYRWE